MRSSLITPLFFMIPLCSIGQELELLSPNGTEAANSEYQLSYSVGELSVQTSSVGDSTVVTQGFHQSKLTVVGLQDPLLGFSIQVYPNPTNDRVTISATDLNRITVFSLYDQRGRLVFETRNKGADQVEIDLSHLSNGTYILRSNVGENDRAFTHQIIKAL